MFTQSSLLVKLWVKYIHLGRNTIEQVPNVSNLVEQVNLALEAQVF